MNKKIRTTAMALMVFFLLFSVRLYAAGAGSRASFTRGGWIGAAYVAMGMSGEIMADDVFSIYWNPAGLSELKAKKKLSVQDIRDKAKSGKAKDISEEDLYKFSEETIEKSFLQIGVSASMLDIDRNAGFAGLAFNLFKGVFGAGVYSILSNGIESYDETGTYLRDLTYSASVGYLSYGWAYGVSSIGITFKSLYEKIGDVAYAGGGADIGVQVFVLPFLKVGFVARDLGVGLYPLEQTSDVEREYDFGFPSLRLGVFMTSDTGVSLAFSGVKKLEQDNYNFGFGVKYALMKNVTIYLGMNDSLFSTGFTFSFFTMDISYALSIDRVDNGYNNMVSLGVLF